MMMEKQRWAENKTENVQSSSYRSDWEWWRNKNMFHKKVNCSWMEEMDIMDFCDQEKLSFRQDLWPWSKGKMSTWKGQFFQEKWHWAISGHSQYREPLLYYFFLNKKRCHDVMSPGASKVEYILQVLHLFLSFALNSICTVHGLWDACHVWWWSKVIFVWVSIGWNSHLYWSTEHVLLIQKI